MTITPSTNSTISNHKTSYWGINHNIGGRHGVSSLGWTKN